VDSHVRGAARGRDRGCAGVGGDEVAEDHDGGKFAGITGTGTMKGSLTGAPFVFSGHYRS
jgi:hypothetical protein